MIDRVNNDEITRCAWAKNTLAIAYHDTEWGVPTHDDRELFELLVLEGAQAGLSWDTILAKRQNYRQAFDDFDVARVANYDEKKVAELLQNSGIVRNRLKIASAIKNAQAYMRVQQEYCSFSEYLWQFVGGEPIVNNWCTMADVPASTALSDAISKDLKRRGFSFVGSTIIYAYMQSAGLVNDHIAECVARGKG